MPAVSQIDWDKLQHLLINSLNPFSYNILKNPFQKIPFIDIPSINEAVTKKFHTLLSQLQQTGETTSMLILGQTGVGKTHILRRIKQLCRGKALYIYVEPYGDPYRIHLHILRRVVACLNEKLEGEQYTQMEEFGTAILANLLLPRLEKLKDLGQNEYFLSKILQDKHEVHCLKREENIRAIISAAKKDILKLMPDIYLQFFEVLVRCLFDRYCIPAYQWLQGSELEDDVLASLGVSSNISTEEDARFALFTLGKLSRLYLPLVICFDQLENLPGDNQKTGISLFASVYTYMHDNIENLLLISTCLLEKWQQEFIDQINLSERKRFDNYQTNLNATLTYMQAQQLIEKRLATVYHDQLLPYSTYPFPPGYIRVLADERLFNIRDILENCRDHIDRIKEEGIMSEAQSVIMKEATPQEIVRFIQDNWDKREAEWAEEVLARGVSGDILKGCFYELFNLMSITRKSFLADTVVQKVQYDDSRYHHLEFYLSRSNQEHWIKLIFCNTQSGTNFATLMKSLLERIELQGVQQTFIVLRDEKLLPLKNSWKKGIKYLQEFQEKGGMFSKISSETQLRLLASRELLYDANSKNLVIKRRFISPEEILNFVLEKGLFHALPEIRLVLATGDTRVKIEP